MNRGVTIHCLITLLGWANVAGAGDLQISEILTANRRQGVDEDGDHSDWIELWNPGTTAINLAHWGLSDDAGTPFRWRFPEIVMERGARLLVWASGKDRPTPTHLHTNFKLSAAGEVLVLTSPDGDTADRISIPTLPGDISYGRGTLGVNPEGWYYFDQPTPGRPNNTTPYLDILDPPIPSMPSGIFTNGFALTLSHPIPGVRIYYTLDGSEPTQTNLGGTSFFYKNLYPDRPGDSFGDLLPASYRTIEYLAAIPISDRSGDPNYLSTRVSTWERVPGTYFVGPYPRGRVFKGQTVRAYAVKEGHLPSAFVTRSYFVDRNASEPFTLPILSVVIPEADLFDYTNGIYCPGVDFDTWRRAEPNATPIPWRRPANFGRRGQDWEKRAHLEILDAQHGSLLEQSCGLRIHGADERSYPQKSLRFYADHTYEARDQFHLNLFPGARGSLHNRTLEGPESFRRMLFVNALNQQDVISHAIMSPAEVCVQRSRAMSEYINGEYWGVVFARDRYDRYYIEKRYGVDPDNVILLFGPYGEGLPYMVEDGVPEDLGFYQDLYHLARDTDQRLVENYRKVQTLLDIDSYIDFNIVFVYLNNTSWNGFNHFRFWRARKTSQAPFQDGKFRILVWDFDHFTQDPAYDNLADAVDPAGGGNFLGVPEKTVLLRGLLENSEFRNRMLNRFASHINTTFRPERLEAIARDGVSEIKDEMRAHLNRWSFTVGEVELWAKFGRDRPIHMREHLRKHLGAGPDVLFRVETSSLDQGTVEIEGFDPSDVRFSHLPNPFPWDVTYFGGIPITIEAKPRRGFRFAGWVGLPDGTARRFTTDPATLPSRILATFEPIHDAVLAYYWNFENPESLLGPAISLWAGTLELLKAPDSVISSSAGQGFLGSNARLGDPAGSHLRLESPLGASITLTLPTLGLSNVVLMYETRRSSSGAGLQTVSYTTDGKSYTEMVTVRNRDADPQVVRVDFSDLPGTANNPDFGVRIRFEPGDGGATGNNRFDNLTLEGEPVSGINFPPIRVAMPSELSVVEGSIPDTRDLSTWFRDLEKDPLSFDIEVDQTDVLAAVVEGRQLRIRGLRTGQARISIHVRDAGSQTSRRFILRVTVNPSPHSLASGTFQFSRWDPDEPDGVFPSHMAFLQSREDDPGPDAPLPDLYSIPLADEHHDDSNTVGFPYNNSRRTRINGLGEEGVAFLNTGRDRDLGGALLSLDTRGCRQVEVRWLAQIRTAGDRIQGLRLQYRLEPSGSFQDLERFGQLFELRGRDASAPVAFQATLPETLMGQEHLQLLWRYYLAGGADGLRTEIRLDEIEVRQSDVSFAFPIPGNEVAAGDTVVALDIAYRTPPPGILRIDGEVAENFTTLPRWALVRLAPGLHHLDLEWKDPEPPGLVRRADLWVTAVSNGDIWFETPRPGYVDLGLRNEIDLPLAESGFRSRWGGYGSMVPGMRFGEPDPFGGSRALFVPGADTVGDPGRAASGIVFGSTRPMGPGHYLVEVWLRCEDQSLNMNLGMSGGAATNVIAGPEWRKFTVPVDLPESVEPNGNQVFELLEFETRNAGWWAWLPKVFRIQPVDLLVRTSLGRSTGRKLSLMRNGDVLLQTGESFIQHTALPRTTEFEFWMAKVTEPDGRTRFSPPTILHVGEKPGLRVASITPLRFSVQAEVNSIVRLETSDDLVAWKILSEWRQDEPETIHQTKLEEPEHPAFFRIAHRVVQ